MWQTIFLYILYIYLKSKHETTYAIEMEKHNRMYIVLYTHVTASLTAKRIVCTDSVNQHLFICLHFF